MTDLNQMTDAELAEYYETHGLADFEGGEFVVPPESASTDVRKTIVSVRLSDAEFDALDASAKAAGMPLTTYIRTAALDAEEPPVNRGEVLDLIDRLRLKVRPPMRTRAAASRGSSRMTTGNKTASKPKATPIEGDFAPAASVKKAANKKALGKRTAVKRATPKPRA